MLGWSQGKRKRTRMLIEKGVSRPAFEKRKKIQPKTKKREVLNLEKKKKKVGLASWGEKGRANDLRRERTVGRNGRTLTTHSRKNLRKLKPLSTQVLPEGRRDTLGPFRVKRGKSTTFAKDAVSRIWPAIVWRAGRLHGLGRSSLFS